MVPSAHHLRTRVIEETYARALTAYPGQGKTAKLVMERYWWPRMMSDINIYVANYMACRSSKMPRDKTPGLLKPIPPPNRAWKCLVIDFNKLPKDRKGYNNAPVIIDRLSKQTWTIPCHENATARDAAQMYYEGPFRLLGVPEEIISD